MAHRARRADAGPPLRAAQGARPRPGGGLRRRRRARRRAYPYDGVGVVVVERDGVSRVLRADLNGTVTATPPRASCATHAAFAEVALVPLVWNDDDREAIATPARRFFAEAAKVRERRRAAVRALGRCATRAWLPVAARASCPAPRAAPLDARLRDAVVAAALVAGGAGLRCGRTTTSTARVVPADLLAGRVRAAARRAVPPSGAWMLLLGTLLFPLPRR